jgi:transposase
MSHLSVVELHNQQPDELKNQVPDPEVVQKAKRRRFSAAYKLRVLREVEQECTERGQIGALLRREGLYSSHLSKWRRQRDRGQLAGLAGQKRGRKPQDPTAAELTALQRENERLRAQLAQAEIIMEVQKKLSQLLGLNTSPTANDEAKS